MTKNVRVENADLNMEKVIIVEEYSRNGDVMVRSFLLEYPTFMTTLCVHDSNYFLIKEKGKND